jgi:cytochrome c556
MAIAVRKIALGVGLATACIAPLFAEPMDAVRARIASYRELGAAYKSVNDVLRSGETQTVLISQSARHISNAARTQYSLFPTGSGPQPRVRTNAKDEIWTKPAQFRAAQDAFTRAADTFNAAVKAGNTATMRTEARKLGATCKGCHDTFRVPE